MLDTYLASGQMEYVDLETMYCDHVKNSFDLEAIKNSGINIAFDAMYGSGQNVLERVLPGHILLHCEHDDSHPFAIVDHAAAADWREISQVEHQRKHAHEHECTRDGQQSINHVLWLYRLSEIQLLHG